MKNKELNQTYYDSFLKSQALSSKAKIFEKTKYQKAIQDNDRKHLTNRVLSIIVNT